ncbi:hypothetical protein [Jongsikchunia kroppenstedtii]|uniref:hypothetical protein n=1 Tax=Jongsikchunia kroppenstedtii TaxID=1121721 RepID=UPI0003784503|nr:hypothetical protein [Jongsikchunia kroppenstedtii]
MDVLGRLRALPDGIAAITKEAGAVGMELARVGWELSDPANIVVALRTLRQVIALADPDRPLGKALAAEGGIGEALAPGGAVDKLLDVDGGVGVLFGPDGLLERAVREGGTLDQVKTVEETLQILAPTLKELTPRLQSAMDDTAGLKDTPLGDFATGLLAQGQRRSRRRTGRTSDKTTVIDAELATADDDSDPIDPALPPRGDT